LNAISLQKLSTDARAGNTEVGTGLATILAPAIDDGATYANRGDASYAAELAPLRTAVELDGFGLVAQVNAPRPPEDVAALFRPVLAYPMEMASARAAEPVAAAAPEPVPQPALPTAAAKPNGQTPAAPARGVSSRHASYTRKAQVVKVASLGNIDGTGPPMRIFPAGWKPIDTAPLDQAVTLLVTDGRGEPYPIPYPCKRTAAGWVSSEGTPLAVTPLQWKPYVPRQR
jgi:hypothetical protein